jgi:hypothetical protein
MPSDNLPTHPRGPYILSGPVAKPDAQALPLRGDLAHIGLAGRYFVPHYALPQPRIVMPGGASLHVAANDKSEEICVLMEGDSFEVLDLSGGWAWGCLSITGPVGYIKMDLLELVS